MTNSNYRFNPIPVGMGDESNFRANIPPRRSRVEKEEAIIQAIRSFIAEGNYLFVLFDIADRAKLNVGSVGGVVLDLIESGVIVRTARTEESLRALGFKGLIKPQVLRGYIYSLPQQEES